MLVQEFENGLLVNEYDDGVSPELTQQDIISSAAQDLITATEKATTLTKLKQAVSDFANKLV